MRCEERIKVIRKQRNSPYGMVSAIMAAPALVIIAALIVVPLVLLVIASFTDFNVRSLFTGEFEPVGLTQYVRLFTDVGFIQSLTRTAVFAGALVAGSMLIGMAVAQMMTRLGSTMRVLVSLSLIVAWAMPNVASSLVFAWMFQPGYGVVGWALTQMRVFGDVRNLSWTADPRLAFVCIWLLVIWQAVPYIALTVYAAQTQLDHAYLEAASLDGAGPIRAYWSITVPLLKPQLSVIAVLSVIWDFNVFNQIWLLTQGGPGTATATVGVFTYRKAFIGFDIGQGSAISVVTTLLLMVLTTVYIRRLLHLGEDL